MFTKCSLHEASSLQTSANAIDINVVNISFHLILFKSPRSGVLTSKPFELNL